MSELIWILGATVIVSLIALIGILTISFSKSLFKDILVILVGLSAGTLIGGAFLHLIPEALESSESNFVFVLVLAGFSIFFLMEKVLKWHHCHEGECHVHTFTYMSLLGDAVHNFLDGMIIAASFLVNIPFGIVTTIAIIAHEVPQEMGDFAILMLGGFSKAKALIYNFLIGMTSILGALIGFFLSGLVENLTSILIPLAAGTFIYIAASDLIPELHKELKVKKSIASFALFIGGILFMWGMKFLFE
jgi:zinc and cadmium transporter